MSMETQTQTLTGFLLARIAEDEALARETDDWDEPSSLWPCETGYGPTAIAIPTRRVLAECEAKRRIAELHDRQRSRHVVTGELLIKDYCAACGNSEHGDDGGGYGSMDVPWPCPTLRALALPYADHPDWREEWRA